VETAIGLRSSEEPAGDDDDDDDDDDKKFDLEWKRCRKFVRS